MNDIQNLLDQACLNNKVEFKDKMCDQLSEFEENRAMNEIYKHDDIIRQEKEKR